MKRIAQILIMLLLCTTPMNAQRKKAVAKKPVAPKLTPEEIRTKALFDDMLPNTQRVFVIDSIVVAQDSALDVISLPIGNGRILPYNNFFSTDSQPDSYVFVDGFGSRCYYSEADESGIHKLYRKDKLGDSWGEAQPIEGLGDELEDMNCPFMAADGTTLYFSAKSEASLGGYDIFVSTYDADEGSFMKAENIGLPFNSTGDDYMYIVDENDSVAWFASTRCQEEGNVCVYTFVPSSSRQNYDEDDFEDKQFRDLANLTRIRSTWPTPEIRENALKRVNELKQRQSEILDDDAICFAVNDKMVYNNTADFSSKASQQAFQIIKKKQKTIADAEANLNSLRKDYHNANNVVRRRLASQILKEEQRIDGLKAEVDQISKELRNKEITVTNKH